MNGRFDDYEDFGSSELMRLALREKNITTAKQVAEHYDEVQRIKDSMRARNEAREFAVREKEKIETNRYLENRRLSIVAIRVAVASAVIGIVSVILALVAIFK